MKKYILIISTMSVSILLFQNFADPFDLTQVGSDNTVTVARGQKMGTCLFQLNSYRQNSGNISDYDLNAASAWPVTSCQGQQQVTCADGFQHVAEIPVQMNCAKEPSWSLENCYWVQHRCISTTGSMKAADFVRGEEYGNCLIRMNAAYSITYTDPAVVWPITRCDSSGIFECAAGFSVVKSTPVQENCSPDPAKTNTLNCYWETIRCVKN